MKRLRFGRRRSNNEQISPLALALAPALEDGRWRVADRFNFTRDVVEPLAEDRKREALTLLGADGVIEPRTFRQLSEGASKWASILRARGIEPGDRVIVLSHLNPDWVEVVLGCLKAGAVAVPIAPGLPTAALESRTAVSGAALIVASDESSDAIAQMSFAPEVQDVLAGRLRKAADLVEDEPTEDTSSRDVALVLWTAGTVGSPKPVAHTHGSLFAARAQAEHWLEAGPGDVVWCTAGPQSALTVWATLAGPWARGAAVVLQEGGFDPAERLELVRRAAPTTLCQTPAEYRALLSEPRLRRSRPSRLRHLVSTGDYLEPEVVAAFQEAWGLTIRSGYGQAETGIVTATAATEGETRPGAIGTALPGHHVGVVDDQGNELPPGIEGDLAVRGRPPTLFAGYWDSPEETRRAFRGDWYVTGDVAAVDEEGSFVFLGRTGEVITSRGRTFGPHEVERVLSSHEAVRESAVVGVRDLERGGQFVRAFVVLDSGAQPTEQLEAELRHFVGSSLPDQQTPRDIEFVDALPTSSTGAIQRLELRERPASGRPLWEAPEASESEPQAASVPEARAAPEPVLRTQPALEPQPEPEPLSRDEAVAESAATFEQAPAQAFVEPEAPFPVISDSVTPVAAEPLPAEPVPAEPTAAEPTAAEPTAAEPTVAEPVAAPEPPPARPEQIPAIVEEPPAPMPPAPVTPVQLLPDGDAGEPAPPLEPAAQLEPAVPLEPAAPTEPEQEPEARIVPAPEPEPEPDAEAEPPESAEPEPAHALEARKEPGPDVAVQEPEPLPEYIVAPERPDSLEAPRLQPVPPPAPEPEPDPEDLGPLPEYIVDPARRLQPVASSEPEPAPAEPSQRDTTDENPLAALARPPVVLPSPEMVAPDEDRAPPERGTWRRTGRAPAPERRKHERSMGEPGDEGLADGWMEELSSRLGAYGVGGTDAGEPEGTTKTGTDDDPGGDEESTSTR